jgi:hypothetical protein
MHVTLHGSGFSCAWVAKFVGELWRKVTQNQTSGLYILSELKRSLTKIFLIKIILLLLILINRIFSRFFTHNGLSDVCLLKSRHAQAFGYQTNSLHSRPSTAESLSIIWSTNVSNLMSKYPCRAYIPYIYA